MFPGLLGWASVVSTSSLLGMTTSLDRINTTAWNLPLGFDQAQLRPAPGRLLTLAGQGSLDESVADQLLAKIDEIAKIFWETKQA